MSTLCIGSGVPRHLALVALAALTAGTLTLTTTTTTAATAVEAAPRAREVSAAITAGASETQWIGDAHYLAVAAWVYTRGVEIALAVASPPASRVAPRNTAGGTAPHLEAIKACESGGNYAAVSPSGQYRGAYQFDQQTWNGVGGTGDPAAASPAEQDYRAQLLYDQRGAQPWPVCGR